MGTSAWPSKITPALNTCPTCAHANIPDYAFDGHCKLDGREITRDTVNCCSYINADREKRRTRYRLFKTRENW